MFWRLWCRLFGHWMEEGSSVTVVMPVDPISCFVGQRIECYNVWQECTVCGMKEEV